jgi:uncharacterized membrane protein YdjX (TVP38/TMEM64 family)
MNVSWRVLPVAVLALVFVYYGFTDRTWLIGSVSRFLIYIESLGYLAPLIFLIIHCLAITVCFPLTILLEWGCGFLFGIVGGSCLILLSKSAGAFFCFFIGMILILIF